MDGQKKYCIHHAVKCREDFELNENSMPYLEVPKGLSIRAIPPFAGAVIRYNISDTKTKTKSVSVYLDCYDNLGCCERPYYEVYFFDLKKRNNTARYWPDQTKKMISDIKKAILK